MFDVVPRVERSFTSPWFGTLLHFYPLIFAAYFCTADYTRKSCFTLHYLFHKNISYKTLSKVLKELGLFFFFSLSWKCNFLGQPCLDLNLYTIFFLIMKYVSFSKRDSTEVVKEENKPYPEFYHSEKPMAPAWVPLDFSEIVDTHCVRPQHRRPREGGEKVHFCLSYPRSVLVTQMPAPTSRMTGSSLRQWLCSHSPSNPELDRR